MLRERISIVLNLAQEIMDFLEAHQETDDYEDVAALEIALRVMVLPSVRET